MEGEEAVIGLEVRTRRALAGLAAATDLERLPAAHLLELLLGHRLLGEERRLDAVEQAFEPADELRLGDPQFAIGRHRVDIERQRSERSSSCRSGDNASDSSATERS